MKGLYLDLCIKYANPTRNLIASLLKRVFSDLDIYGLGYISEDVLKLGIRVFVEKNGPYDFIVTNEFIIFSEQSKSYEEKSKKTFLKSFQGAFHDRLLDEKYFADILNFFMSTETKKILYLIQTDFYNVNSYKIDMLESIPDLYFITFGSDVICSKKNMPFIKYEKFHQHVSDNWFDFVNRNNSKIVSLPHFVSEYEFEYSAIDDRKYMLNVPGVKYWFRDSVHKQAKKKYKIVPHYQLMIYPILAKIGLRPFSYEIGRLMYNLLFIKSIKDSRFTFTCGSALKWPLRKFFEIPALGSVLICYPFSSHEHFGFINKKTCIIISSPDEILGVIEVLRNDLVSAQQIASDGQDMVMRNHSLSARVSQLTLALNCIKENKFFGASFKDGIFKCNES